MVFFYAKFRGLNTFSKRSVLRSFVTLHLCIVNFKDLIKICAFYYFK